MNKLLLDYIRFLENIVLIRSKRYEYQ